ncbi:MAG: bifunctional riboflavin kinase/FAD synthetase [Clostridia bacterium]|nr:bifunctional riboflavin kinase/FAD synthetase [Clostridia bacterium]
MKILQSLKQIGQLNTNTAVALGTFDGVHIAHQQIISKTVSYARENNLKSVVYTFSNHPRELTPGIETPKKLLTPTQKIEIIEQLGVDILIILPFDMDQLTMEPEYFIEDILLKRLKVKHITVGYDFRFGKNAKGNTNMLKEYSEQMEFSLDVVEPIRYKGVLISSTFIRNCLLSGDVHCANRLLGRAYCVQGTVVTGKQVGRKLGFPTINLKTEFEMSVLKPGVYATMTDIDGKIYYSATNVGFNPTFDQEHFTIETFIFNFNKDIYGHKVKIIFEEYIRPEIKFDNLEDLIQQIGDDVTQIKKYFNLSDFDN